MWQGLMVTRENRRKLITAHLIREHRWRSQYDVKPALIIKL